jgi:hypothetical protein
MSVEQTNKLLHRYFNAMGNDRDFSEYYAEDVTWVMVDSGQTVHGPSAVRDYILELHSKMFDHKQRDLDVTDGHAYLEGSAVAEPGGTGPRFTYCLVYDLDAERISATRCYGTLATLMLTGSEVRDSITDTG